MKTLAKCALTILGTAALVSWAIQIILAQALLSQSAHAATLWAAYGGFIIAAAFLSLAGCLMAAECRIDGGVTVGGLIAALTFGPGLAAIALAVCLVGWPVIATAYICEKRFPSEKKEKKELPPSHWSKRVVLRCHKPLA